jgi:hypothetical protein
LTILVAATALGTGCAPEIRWRGLIFDPVHRDAQRDHRPTFAYLRAWYLPACTRFEDNVLKDPDVVAASTDFYCTLLEYDASRRLVEQWMVESPPAVVILDDNSQILVRLQGEIPKQALLAAMNRIQARFAPPPVTQPTASPPITPEASP